MKIENSVAFVTGANRGLGLAFAKALLAGGARKVYAAARDPDSITLPGVTPIRLDVTNADEIAAAARACGDVDLAHQQCRHQRAAARFSRPARSRPRARRWRPIFSARCSSAAPSRRCWRATAAARSSMCCRRLSWISFPTSATYSASKAAAWSLTNGLRNELRAQGTQVVGLHVGYMDTDMAARIDAPKSRPEDVVQVTLDGARGGRRGSAGRRGLAQPQEGPVGRARRLSRRRPAAEAAPKEPSP